MNTSRANLLFVDAYDSFSESIISLLQDLLSVSVSRIQVDSDIRALTGQSNEDFFRQFDAIVLGPGPGNPSNEADVGLYRTVWEVAARHRTPVLGICLGFQSLCATFGMKVSRLPLPCHGHAKTIEHNDNDIFRNAGSVVATCYNSLGIRAHTSAATPQPSRPPSRGSDASTRPPSSRTSFDSMECSSVLETGAALTPLAWDMDGWLQAVKHSDLPFWGLQFHPESCKSNDSCHTIVETWFTDVCKHNAHKPTPGRLLLNATPAVKTRDQPPQFEHDLLSHMLSATADARDIRYRKLQIALDRQRMARFCYRLARKEGFSMLESSQKGRYSIYAITDDHSWTLEYGHGRCRMMSNNSIRKAITSLEQAMDLVETFMASRIISEGPKDSPFWGGLVGYFSYELGLDLLQISDHLHHQPEREIPEYSLMWIDRTIVVDKLDGMVYVQSLRADDKDWIESTASSLSNMATAPKVIADSHEKIIATYSSTPDHKAYTNQISTCQSELHAGNSYELCLTTSATITLPNATSPFDLHQQLLQHNPSTYSAILCHHSVTILSSSPEQFLSWARPTLTTPQTILNMQPMKGTLAKYSGLTPQLASKLLRTPKEEAENLMIVDLIRHDLARALPSAAKITVPKLFELVEAETVYQLISHIQAAMPAGLPASMPTTSWSQLRRQYTDEVLPSSQNQHEHPLYSYKTQTLRHALSTLRSTLPPGSMTGAPKKRSCEILRSLEQRNRGVYAGVVGYLDVGGGGAWSVAIRCAFSPTGRAPEVKRCEEEGKQGEAESQDDGRKWHVGAGGAVTVLSDVEGEWEEMRVKMESVLRGFRVPG